MAFEPQRKGSDVPSSSSPPCHDVTTPSSSCKAVCVRSRQLIATHWHHLRHHLRGHIHCRLHNLRSHDCSRYRHTKPSDTQARPHLQHGHRCRPPPTKLRPLHSAEASRPRVLAAVFRSARPPEPDFPFLLRTPVLQTKPLVASQSHQEGSRACAGCAGHLPAALPGEVVLVIEKEGAGWGWEQKPGRSREKG